MPEIIVSIVSWSDLILNVGSSSESALKAMPILSWSCLVFGSTAQRNNRFRKLDGLKQYRPVGVAKSVPRSGALQAHKRGYVASPHFFISSLELACILKIRPTLSLLPVEVL